MSGRAQQGGTGTEFLAGALRLGLVLAGGGVVGGLALGGLRAGLGVGVGAALGIVPFWLQRSAVAGLLGMSAKRAGRCALVLWVCKLVWMSLFVWVGVGSRLVHPAGLCAGATALPIALVVAAVRARRRIEAWFGC